MTSSTLASITVDTAPRDAEQLAGVGRFQLRRLAEGLGLFDTDAKKSGFMSGTPQDMAQAVLLALKAYDARSEGPVRLNGNGTSKIAHVGDTVVLPPGGTVTEIDIGDLPTPVPEKPKRQSRAQAAVAAVAPEPRVVVIPEVPPDVTPASSPVTPTQLILEQLHTIATAVHLLNKKLGQQESKAAETQAAFDAAIKGLQTQMNTLLLTIPLPEKGDSQFAILKERIDLILSLGLILAEADPHINAAQSTILLDTYENKEGLEGMLDAARTEQQFEAGK